jgi:hypothetical protein
MRLSGERGEGWFTGLYGIADAETLSLGPGAIQPDSVAALADLRAALVTLPGIDQEILRLVGWEQLTVAEAALVLDCSRTAAAVRLLAHENVTLRPRRLTSYSLLDSGRTDQAG